MGVGWVVGDGGVVMGDGGGWVGGSIARQSMHGRGYQACIHGVPSMHGEYQASPRDGVYTGHRAAW